MRSGRSLNRGTGFRNYYREARRSAHPSRASLLSGQYPSNNGRVQLGPERRLERLGEQPVYRQNLVTTLHIAPVTAPPTSASSPSGCFGDPAASKEGPAGLDRLVHDLPYEVGTHFYGYRRNVNGRATRRSEAFITGLIRPGIDPEMLAPETRGFLAAATCYSGGTSSPPPRCGKIRREPPTLLHQIDYRAPR